MARVLTPNGSIFLDTSYAVALASRTDSFHDSAIALAERLEASSIHLVTTWAVLLEIGNALSKMHYRNEALRLLHSLQRDPLVEVIPLTETLIQRAINLFAERPDKDWGLTDCISFVVMQERGIPEALTADEHFQQAGFRTLLREVPLP